MECVLQDPEYAVKGLADKIKTDPDFAERPIVTKIINCWEKQFIPPSLEVKMTTTGEKICNPETLPDDKMKAIDACQFTGLKVDPLTIETCNEQEYGKISLNDKRKKKCAMNHEDQFTSSVKVSINRIDLSLDFYLLLLFVFR